MIRSNRRANVYKISFFFPKATFSRTHANFLGGLDVKVSDEKISVLGGMVSWKILCVAYEILRKLCVFLYYFGFSWKIWFILMKKLCHLLGNSYIFLLLSSLLENLMCSRFCLKKSLLEIKTQIFCKIARRLLLKQIWISRRRCFSDKISL